MFGRRSDGYKVKNLDIIEKAGPYFMPQRIDGVNYYAQAVDCENLDKFILEQKQKNGVHYSYTEIMIAACVRMLHERPKTNRFINDCVIYQRNYISISMTVKKKLTDDGEELTLKFPFKGTESLQEVKKIVDEEIERNINSVETTHETTKDAAFLCKLPSWMFKFAMAVVRWMDKHNMLPKSLIHASPFHTSMFITDLRSVKLDKVYHHLYNFGNTTIFASLGKVMYDAVADRSGEISVKKRVKLGFSLDERVCDGLYYGTSLRYVMKLIENPELLLEPLPEKELTGKELKRKQKQDKKAKKLEKKNKKAAK